MVILNNQDYENLATARKDELERFVQHGGGLLIIGGEETSTSKASRKTRWTGAPGETRAAPLSRGHLRGSDHR